MLVSLTNTTAAEHYSLLDQKLSWSPARSRLWLSRTAPPMTFSAVPNSKQIVAELRPLTRAAR